MKNTNEDGNDYLGSIKEKQEYLLSIFESGKDYGKTAYNSNKKTLQKSGAEKIIQVFQMSTEFHLIKEIEDFEKSIILYTFRCDIVDPTGRLITQGFGSCNTREKRYLKTSIFDVINTIIKMAKKRSLVDAALSLSGFSNDFTQDVDDDDEKVEGKTKSKTIIDLIKELFYEIFVNSSIKHELKEYIVDKKRRSTFLRYLFNGTSYDKLPVDAVSNMIRGIQISDSRLMKDINDFVIDNDTEETTNTTNTKQGQEQEIDYESYYKEVRNKIYRNGGISTQVRDMLKSDEHFRNILMAKLFGENPNINVFSAWDVTSYVDAINNFTMDYIKKGESK